MKNNHKAQERNKSLKKHETIQRNKSMTWKLYLMRNRRMSKAWEEKESQNYLINLLINKIKNSQKIMAPRPLN